MSHRAFEQSLSSDWFGVVRYLYPGKWPITRLYFVGEQGGKFYYAAADHQGVTLPRLNKGMIAVSGKLAGRKP